MNPSLRRKLRFLLPLVALAVIALATLAVQSLWNGVLVDVLGVKAVTYWQALGIFVLAKILFVGFPGGRRGPFDPRIRDRLHKARWDALSPEQRELMREEMRDRFGHWPRPPWCEDRPEKSGDEAKA